jgi:RNA polymerase sigma-70 factor, ECF subfamily
MTSMCDLSPASAPAVEAALPHSNSAEFSAQIVESLTQLRRQARGFVGPHGGADDLVQDTIVRALAAQHQFTPGTNLRGWLYTIMRNANYSNHRGQRFFGDSIDDALESRGASAPQQLVQLELKEVLTALGTLPQYFGDTLLLVCREGMSYEEAAVMSGCAVGTAKSRVNRARRALALRYETSDADADRKTSAAPGQPIMVKHRHQSARATAA